MCHYIPLVPFAAAVPPSHDRFGPGEKEQTCQGQSMYLVHAEQQK